MALPHIALIIREALRQGERCPKRCDSRHIVPDISRKEFTCAKCGSRWPIRHAMLGD